ncbi:ComEC/Rec2 family competence protein [Paenibacillus naphthalenovorans]|uniref:Competence protein ComEC n=1 Tax=Paenibacillus naphthalenovorans TaxID=162209 RepID=A0A0U2MUR9_9BACL|nr:competence protein ComEC [Paenibacillus naphthalenovorans]
MANRRELTGIGRRPIVMLALCWTLGYAVALVYPMAWMNLFLAFGAGIFCCLVLMLKPRGSAWFAGMLIALAAAGWYGEYDAGNRSLIRLEAEETNGAGFRGRIMTPVEVDGDRVSFQAKADRVSLAEGFPPENGGRGELVQFSIRLVKQEEQEMAKHWQRGDKIELEGTLLRLGEARNFGGFDYRDYLRFQHIHWQMTAKGLDGISVTPPAFGEWGGWLVLRANDRFREQLAAKVEQLFPEEQSGFMKGMLIGLEDDIDPELFDQFSRLGLTHIIAISGLNVAIFLACLIWLMRRCGFTRETYLLTAIALMPVYIAVTGAAPSIVRAGIMAMIGLYAAYRHRLKDGLHIALIAGVGMLIWEPYYLVNVSFQLSFLVTLGIILGVPAMNKLLPLKRPRLRDAVSITVVAQFVSFPLTIYYFSQFSLLSFAANFLLVPVFSMIVMPAGTAAMLLSFLSLYIAKPFAWFVSQVNTLLFWIVDGSSRSEWFQTIWPSPEPVWILMYYGLLALLVVLMLGERDSQEAGEKTEPMLYTMAEHRGRERARRWIRYVLLPAVIVSFAAVLWTGYDPRREKAEGRVHFIDVGQGDSILIQPPGNGGSLLIDGGGTLSFRKPGEEWKQRRDPYEVGRKLLVPLLKKRGVQTIDELILTHQDVDHFGGLQAVIEQIPVKRLIFNGTLKPAAGVEKLFQTALDRGIQLVDARAGDRLEKGQGTVLHFLYPFREADGSGLRLEQDQNPSSIVFLMEMSGTRWLFAGDIGEGAERKLLERWSALEPGTSKLLEPPVDVLKVAHHGSKSSTSELWLRAWRPRHAVISAGVKNVYGHPHPSVLERLAAHRVSVHRTDRHGEVQMTVREGKIYMRTKMKE